MKKPEAWCGTALPGGSLRVKLRLTFERFTDRARRVLVLAQEEATLLNHAFIGTEHILLGLISEGDGLAAQALARLHVSRAAVHEMVEKTVGPALTPPTGSAPFTPRAKRVLELAFREALQLGHKSIGTEHILLGLVREGEGVGALVLEGLGADLPKVRQTVIQLIFDHQASQDSISRRSARRRLQPVPERPAAFSEVGRELTAKVVRAGRTPADYEAAYREIRIMFEGVGIWLTDDDLADVVVASVETDEGPRLSISFGQPIEFEPERGDGGTGTQ